MSKLTGKFSVVLWIYSIFIFFSFFCCYNISTGTIVGDPEGSLLLFRKIEINGIEKI